MQPSTLGSFTGSSYDINYWNKYENCTYKLSAKPAKGQCVNSSDSYSRCQNQPASHLSPVKKRVKGSSPYHLEAKAVSAAEATPEVIAMRKAKGTAPGGSARGYKEQRQPIVIPDTPSPAVSVITISSDSEEDEPKCASPKGWVDNWRGSILYLVFKLCGPFLHIKMVFPGVEISFIRRGQTVLSLWWKFPYYIKLLDIEMWNNEMKCKYIFIPQISAACLQMHLEDILPSVFSVVLSDFIQNSRQA